MAIRSKTALVIAVSIALCLNTPLFAQQVQDPCKDSAQGPEDASLVLSLKDKQTVYREGEIIGLTLAYTSGTLERYSLSTRNYDRSGRLDAETFCIEPATGRDPLADYFYGLYGGFIGGGIGGMQTLGSSAAIIDIELNEWRSLPPGRYQLRLVSRRVQRPAAAGETGGSIVNVPLRSNTIEFQIVGATPDWQAAQLESAIRALDSGPTEESRRRGARILRFLGSDAAARELIKRSTDSKDQTFNSDFKFGLIGSPRRQLVMDAMKAAITDPQNGITNEFIETLALLEIQTKGEYPLPPLTDGNRVAWNTARERKFEAYRATIAQHMAELSRVVASKTATALAVSINTLLAAPPASADRGGLQQMLAASWDSLPVRTRNELIAYRWKDIKGPGMLPILRGIVDTPRNPQTPGFQAERGAALSRIYELSPEEGRELILREMLNTSDVGIDVLGLLPDRELPEIEEPLLAKLRNSNATYVDYQLIERYATAKPLPEMKMLYEKSRGKWACDPQKSFLNYFLKFDQRYGVAQIKDALQQREETGCYRSLLADLRTAIATPELEQLAIAALNDPDADVARSAADALGRYGSASAEIALWERLEAFHEKWKDRTGELRTLGARDSEGSAAASLEYFLITALTQGQAWVADREKLERLNSLISPPRQNELKSLIAEWQQGGLYLFTNWMNDGRFSYNIAKYSGDSVQQLAGKLRQFPQGTRIVLALPPSVEAEHRSDIDTIRDAARTAGIILEINR